MIKQEHSDTLLSGQMLVTACLFQERIAQKGPGGFLLVRLMVSWGPSFFFYICIFMYLYFYRPGRAWTQGQCLPPPSSFPGWHLNPGFLIGMVTLYLHGQACFPSVYAKKWGCGPESLQCLSRLALCERMGESRTWTWLYWCPFGRFPSVRPIL